MNVKLPLNLSRLLRRPGPVGLDIGARHVKAVQVAPAGTNTWRATAAAVFPRATPHQTMDREEAARVVEVLDRQGFVVSRGVVVGVPQALLMTSVLELPPRAPGVPIEQIARMELARVHARDAGSFEFAQWEVPPPARAANSTHVMAVACGHEPAGALLDALESQGLDVHALDAESCAIVRACRPVLDPAGGMSAVLDLGYGAARMLIVYRGAIVYTRSIDDAGAARLLAGLQRQLEADEATVAQLLAEDFFAAGAGEESRAMVTAHFDALLKEIAIAFSYATQQYSVPAVSGLLLVGGGADMPGVADRLAAALRLPVAVATPATLIDTSAAPRAARSASMTAALGLALYREANET